MTRRTYDPNDPTMTRALDELRPELEAIPAAQLEPIRLDLRDAVVDVLGSERRIRAYRDVIAAELGESAAQHVDRLQKVAQACFRAHSLYLPKLHGDDVEELISSLSQKRRVLVLEAQGLVAKKLLPATALAELEGGTGYRAMCLDVMQLVGVLRAEWTTIAHETPVTLLELDQAEALANAVAIALGENARGTVSSESAELRQRAYTLFVRTYDEIRRALTFVRWDEDDVDEIAPSLYAGRTRHKNDDEVVANGPVATPVTNGSNGAPTNGAAPIPPGMPGGSPFVS